jgi:hypothetical protein
VPPDVETGGVAATLERALGILRNEAPAAYYRLAGELDGMSALIEVERERFQLRCAADRIVFGPPAGAPDVSIRTNPTTILALIDGRTGVMDCILAGELELRASVDVLPNIARASVAFAEGAIRSRGMRALLLSFRQAVAPPAASPADQNFRSIM